MKGSIIADDGDTTSQFFPGINSDVADRLEFVSSQREKGNVTMCVHLFDLTNKAT